MWCHCTWHISKQPSFRKMLHHDFGSWHRDVMPYEPGKRQTCHAISGLCSSNVCLIQCQRLQKDTLNWQPRKTMCRMVAGEHIPSNTYALFWVSGPPSLSNWLACCCLQYRVPRALQRLVCTCLLVSKQVATGELHACVRAAAIHALRVHFYLPMSIWWQLSVGGVPMETKRIFGLSSLLIQFALSSSGLNLNS